MERLNEKLKNLPDILTLQQACEVLNCHPNTLRGWDNKGVLKALRFGKRGDRRYRKKDIVKVMSDKLFQPGKDWQCNACLNYLFDHLDTYATGYRQAAALLSCYVKKTHRKQDTLIYPIVFLYRHYLELRLKEILKEGGKLLNIYEGVPYEDIPEHHKIDELWEKSRKVLENIWSDKESKNDLNKIEKYIYEFSRHDPMSFAFRYPTAKRCGKIIGKKSVPDLRHINIRNFSEHMEIVSELLEGASVGISDYLTK